MNIFEYIKNIFDEFFNTDLSLWMSVFIVIIAVFIGLVLNYIIIYRTSLTNKTLKVHGFIEDKDESVSPHFHNNDLFVQNYYIKRNFPNLHIEWRSKHFLFIPHGKINTYKKQRNKLTVWYNGHSSKGIEYKVKKFPKDWKERELSKTRISNYNGTFIISNMLVKTLNLTSLDIDLKQNKKDCVITYRFDNGTKRIQKLTKEDFFSDLFHKTIPYNGAFLAQCEMIELK